MKRVFQINQYKIGIILLLVYAFFVFYITLSAEAGVSGGRLLSTVPYFLLLIIAFYSMIKTNSIPFTLFHFFYGAFVLAVIGSFGVSLIVHSYKALEIKFILQISLFPFVIYSFLYNGLKSNALTEYFLVHSYLIFLFLVSIIFLFKQAEITEVRSVFSGFNHSYYAVLSLPVCLMIRNKIIRVLLFFITLLIVVLSLKRGGVLALVLGGVIYIFLRCYYSSRKFRINKITMTLLMLLTLTVLIVFPVLMQNELFQFALSRFNDIEENGGSGRNSIYMEIITVIFHSNPIDFLCGHGANSVIKEFRFNLTAHNDFLEIFYDFGFIALVAYISMHICIIRQIIKMYKLHCHICLGITISYVSMFVLSMISHLIIYPYFILMLPLWSFIFAYDEQG